MPRAQLKSSNLNHSAIDESTGIISGCKLMQVGRTAHFKRSDGKADSFEITPELISGLLAHAGNRSIPSHWSHDWTDKAEDALHARLGVHKNIRIDADGDLASDLHTMPNEYGRLALWTAKTDPASAAFSAVFQYNPIKDGDRKLAFPLSFDAADLVASAAACSAMLSKIPTDNDMTEDQINKLVEERVTARLATFVPKAPEGFITKEDSDKAITAALSAFKPTLSPEQLAEINTQAEASVVAKLGAGPLQVHLGDQQKSDKYKATLAKFMETHPNPGAAIRAMLTKHPELGPEHEEHLQRQIAILTAA